MTIEEVASCRPLRVQSASETSRDQVHKDSSIASA